MLCWSDVHGRKEMFKKFLEYKSEEEHIILGDISDSRYSGVTYQDQLDCWILLQQSNCNYIFSNHDIQYINGVPRQFWSSDRKLNVPELENIINNMADKYPVAMVVDGYLLTHAGVHDDLVKSNDINEQCDWLNNEWTMFLNDKVDQNSNSPYTRTQFKKYSDIFNIGYSRGGTHSIPGIFWCCWFGDDRSTRFNQVCGHTNFTDIQIDTFTVEDKIITHVNVDNKIGQCFNTKTGKVELFV